MARSLSYLLLLSLAVWLAGDVCLAAPRIYRIAPMPGGEGDRAGGPTYWGGKPAYAPMPDAAPALRLTTWVRPGTPVSGSLAAFSPDGKLLATGNAGEGAVCLWEVRGGRPRVLQAPLRDRHDRVEAIAFSPDGRLLAAAALLDGGFLWEVSTGRAIALMPDARAPLAFSPDGTRLATSAAPKAPLGSGDAALLWDARVGALLARLQGVGPAYELAFSRDGAMLASTHCWASERMPGAVCLWSGRTGEPHKVLWYRRGGLVFAPDGSRLWAGRECIPLTHEAAKLDPRAPWAKAYPCWPRAFSPDGKSVVCDGPEAWPVVADARTGALRGMLRGRLHLGRAEILLSALLTAVLLTGVPLMVGRIGQRCADCHPAVVALAGVGGCLVSPVVAAAVALAVWWPLHHAQAERMLCPIVFSPDSRQIATADASGKVRLWRAGSGRKEAEVRIGARNPSQVLFSPDGTLLLAADSDANVYLWRVRR